MKLTTPILSVCLFLFTVAGLSAQDVIPNETTKVEAKSESSPSLLQPVESNQSGEKTGTASTGTASGSFNLPQYLSNQATDLTSREGTGSAIKIALVLGAISLAPAVLLMTTCYIRIIVVLNLLKQAFGGQQLPPTQILTTLALFLTILIMTPVWKEIKTNAIDPYASAEVVDWEEAWKRGVAPIKRFMATQIEAAGNTEAVATIYRYAPDQSMTTPKSIHEVPLNVLLPAFMISELKVAFLIGFQIFLPFLIIDLIVSSVTVSMGMMMLPPTLVSLPLKLALFVMVDGWNLIVGLLLQSFAPMA